MAHELAGTPIPRWTMPGPPRRHHLVEGQIAVPPSLVTGDHAVLLAAHLKVLHMLTGERTVVTGFHDNAMICCTATVVEGSWRDLVAIAREALGAAVPAESTMYSALDVTGQSANTPLRITVVDGKVAVSGAPAMFTADYVDRVAGYYVAALKELIDHPDRPHHLAELLSAGERTVQLHDLSGPRVPLPDRSFTDLFQARAARHPERVAAMHGPSTLTYQALDTRANQVAHLLSANDLTAGQPVAVVMPRNLEWLAVVLGILKAGGVYLPMRPDFPPDRIGAQLDLSGCRLAVTESGSDHTVREAVTGRHCVVLDVSEADGQPGSAPGVLVRGDDAAYIYFTSGSTGVPKGATCEHAGMLNHLYAKIEDLRLTDHEVCTQLASQCFDISLWQLAAPLLAGGATMIIDTDEQLDAQRFIDRIAGGGIHVIQVVPGYLDVLITHWQHGRREVGDLRMVSVTGEALKRELVRRWFTLFPEIPLVNAYGATEVSDDTMHAVLTELPERDLPIIPVGRTLRNVNTYILDEHLRLVPLGAPGEIAFSGVCVGRGYVNDPERTALAFVDDAYRPGTRLYRTGDFGRWIPEGTIEFLGRRDEQVKIRGYRIEIGEIENRMLAMPGVSGAAVVIDSEDDQHRNLVACYTGTPGPEIADLRDFLAAALPEYMVPAYFHRLDSLPLNDNQKVDKKALVRLAGELGRETVAYTPPTTGTEQRLATVWAEILGVGVGQIGRDADFFALGGTSLAAVLLVVKLDRAISLQQLTARPVLRDMAEVLDVTEAQQMPAGLLHKLSGLDGEPVATLICFPYAGGNAVNFQRLAKELAPAQIAVLGVELPGHDIARPEEPLADVAAVAELVAREIQATVTGPFLFWGHCAGAAHAIATTRLLEAAGRPPVELVIAALMLDDAGALQAETDQVNALTSRQITTQLQDDTAYIELDLLKSERAAALSEAYRHDVRTTNDYLIAQQGSAEPRLDVPVRVVTAADDPTTHEAGQRYERWRQLSSAVTLTSLPAGGHYFVRTKPADVAAIVAACLEPAR